MPSNRSFGVCVWVTGFHVLSKAMVLVVLVLVLDVARVVDLLVLMLVVVVDLVNAKVVKGVCGCGCSKGYDTYSG